MSSLLDRVRRWHSPSVFTLIALCFVLPFATVTLVDGCEHSGTGPGQTSFTGIQLVTHTVPRGTGGSGECEPGTPNACVERETTPAAQIAFAAAILGLVLGLFGIAGGPGWCAAVGLAGLLQILFIGVEFGDHVSPHAGYWLALGLFGWAGVLHIACWQDRKPDRIPRGTGHTIAVVAGVLVLIVITPYAIVFGYLWGVPLLWAAAVHLDRAFRPQHAPSAPD